MARRHPDDDHDWLSASYVDEWVSTWSEMTERPRQLRRVAVAVPIERTAAAAVLDVGAGWGPLSAELLAYHPGATVTLVDYSPPMLDHARHHLSAFGDRARFEQRDLADGSWTEGLGGPFDAVVSSLAIHNLRDPQVVARVYDDIRTLLVPGGWFFNLEVAFPSGAAAGGVVQRLRALDRGEDPDAAGVSPMTVDVGGGPGERVPLSLPHQLQLLQGAGFDEVDCLWRDGWTALLAGRVPAR